MGARELLGKLLVLFIILPAILAVMLFTTQSPEVARSLLSVYYLVAFLAILGLSVKG